MDTAISSSNSRRVLRTGVFWSGIIALIIVPFLTWGETVESLVHEITDESQDARWPAVVLLVILLSFDVVLPIPSSVVAASLGAILGHGWGTVCSAGALTVSCGVGYGLGRWSTRGDRLLTARDIEHMVCLHRRVGDWYLPLTRAAPVLAEAATLFAGAAGMGFSRFLTICVFSNFGVALVYAGAGALAVGPAGFIAAFATALVFPWIAMKLAARIQSYLEHDAPERKEGR